MKCKQCDTNKVFKNKRGLNVHIRIAHKLNEDTAGAPVATTVNSSPEPSMQSTSINDIQREFRKFKDFMIAVVNSLGSKFEKELITIKNRISEINPRFTKETPAPSNIDTPYMIATNNTDTPCINPAKFQLQPPQFSTISPTPTSTDTPFIPIESGPSKTLQRPNCGVQLINRFSALTIPTEQSAVQEQQDQRQQTWQPELTDLPPRNRTSRPFINQRPENDILKIVPGNAKYSEVVKRGSNHRDANDQPNSQSHQQRHQNTYKQKYKLCLLGDSNLHGITIRDFARELNHTAFIDKFAHSGATTVHLRTYAEVALLSKPEGIIIHGGTNDILGRNATSYSEDQIASTLIEIGVKARNENVKDIFISSVLPTKNKLANEKALQINNFLKSYCVAYNFVYIDNSNITQDDLKEEERDLVHLSPTGREALMKNFSHYFNY